jgi:hypothetical protein
MFNHVIDEVYNMKRCVISSMTFVGCPRDALAFVAMESTESHHETTEGSKDAVSIGLVRTHICVHECAHVSSGVYVSVLKMCVCVFKCMCM